MWTQRLNLSSPCTIHLENGGGRQVKTLMNLSPSAVLGLVSDANVAPLLGGLSSQFEDLDTFLHLLPLGDAEKTLFNLSSLFEALLDRKADREARLLAFGGGQVSDMTGLAAGLYRRGIGWSAVPTTLLSQVDAAIGGKTAVNHKGYKNMIGLFHQPEHVIIDPSLLATEPKESFQSGLGEVLKYTFLSPGSFPSLPKREVLLKREPSALLSVIQPCVQIKAEYCQRDEKETGERALLNLGHTFGHAIERLVALGKTRISEIHHGTAVAAGILMAIEASRLSGSLSERAAAEAEARVEALTGLGEREVQSWGLSLSGMQEGMAQDKKNRGEKLRLVLLKEGGAFLFEDFPRAELSRVLGKFCQA